MRVRKYRIPRRKPSPKRFLNYQERFQTICTKLIIKDKTLGFRDIGDDDWSRDGKGSGEEDFTTVVVVYFGGFWIYGCDDTEIFVCVVYADYSFVEVYEFIVGFSHLFLYCLDEFGN